MIFLRKLKATSVALGNGALGIQSDLKLDDEIGDLVVSFNKMSYDLQINQRRLLEAERHSAIETATWVGHDLRNPLQAIQNTKYLINQNVSKLPPELREKVRRAANEEDYLKLHNLGYEIPAKPKAG